MMNSLKSRNRIALVAVENDVVFHALGLLYLGDALKKAGFGVRLFDLFDYEVNPAIINEIVEMKPLFVGFSSLTGGQTKWSYEMSKAIKEKNKDITIVWGGVHPTMLPEDCLKEDCIDILCMGEGEEAIVELANCLSEGKDLTEVRNAAYKREGEFMINPPRPFISNLDLYEPDWSLLKDIERCIQVVHGGRRQICFITSRGCPHNCSFCYNLKFNERKWRRFSSEYVIDKISYLRKRHNIRAIGFHDDNFFVDMQRAFDILERLKEIDVITTTCMIKLEFINEDILKRLRALGVKQVFAAWESGTDRILKLINKGLTRELILEKFRIFSKFPDMNFVAASIIGFPTETWEEICRTIDLGVKLAEMVPNIVVISQVFIPYPGSHLYELATENGFSLPRNMSGYDMFHTFEGNMDLTWLPWADRNTKALFYRVDKYTKMLSHSKGSNALRTLGKNVFYNISRTRLKRKFFAFPWEIPVLYHFNRYYNPKCPI